MVYGKFTKEEHNSLVAYIAVNNPGTRNRCGNKLYQHLVQTEEWAKPRSWSSWREYYKYHQNDLDKHIAKYQDKHNIPRPPPGPNPETPCGFRSRWTSEEDQSLVEFLAEYAPVKQLGERLSKFGRSGNFVYNVILSDPDDFLWAETRTWNAWRERYTKNQVRFDKRIAIWQEEQGIDPELQLKVVRAKYGNRRMPDYLRSRGQDSGNEMDDLEEQDEAIAQNSIKRLRPQEDRDYEESTAVSQTRKKQKLMHHENIEEGVNEQVESSSGAGSELPRVPNIDDEAGRRNGDIDADGAGGKPRHSCHESFHKSPVPEIRLKQEPSSFQILYVQEASSDTPHNEISNATSLHSHLPTTLPNSTEISSIPKSHAKPPDVDTRETTRNVQTLVPSHPPTPPPSNIQSDASILSLSLEPDPPMLSPVVSWEQRTKSPVASLSLSNEPSLDLPDTSNTCQSISNQPPSEHPTPNLFPKSADILPRQHGSLFRSPSLSSISDGPFATSPPSPRRAEIIHSIPKLPERSFRDNARVRTRKVIAAQRKQSNNDQRRSQTGEKHLKDGSSSLSEKTLPNELSYEFQSPLRIKDQGSVNSARATNPVVSSKPSRHANEIDLPITQACSKSPVDRFRSTTRADDVFTNSTTMLSSNNHDPYVLGTSHFSPERSTTSTISRAQTFTPVPQRRTKRHRNRRRTFPEIGLCHDLPTVDLLGELKAKGWRSRSPGLVWTKSSPDITILPEPESRLASQGQLLSARECAVAHREHSRKSVIPIITDLKTGHTTTSSFNQLSPSTSEIIFKEGLAASFKRLEMNHGFSIDVVRRVWLHYNMDLRKTDKKLLRMRLAAEMVIHSDESDTPLNLSSTSKHFQGPADNAPSKAPTDYTPPVRSRAGHYRRFVEQGRHWEARQREIDLAGRLSTTIQSSKVPSPKSSVGPFWSEKEDEILRMASEEGLQLLANKFGERFLRQKALALITR